MSSFLGFCEGDTRNRWRDGQVCPDVDKELWRLGPDGSGDKKRPEREKKGGQESPRKSRKKGQESPREREREKPALNGGKGLSQEIGVKKTMNAGGVDDEAHFWLNGYVNKQNCRIWSEANPQVYVETPLHPEKLTVWCALWAGGIIGPYFFKNDEGHNELWFQQDGATCHTARATIDLLKDTLGDRIISRFGPVNWPPRSCDLTPLDYFLWGYVKSLVYADKPQTLDPLEDNIRRVMADIRPQMLEKVIENWTS
ncbi:uncharacterized protein TNCV_2849831 [Trichonephila clavipes]|nr:uncharacterized protein TNCV_2849831 [Trichonephila clavipes]